MFCDSKTISVSAGVIVAEDWIQKISFRLEQRSVITPLGKGDEIPKRILVGASATPMGMCGDIWILIDPPG